MTLLPKITINKERLCGLVAAKDRSFIDKVDRLATVDLSTGKWKKLYALLAQAREISGENIFIYASDNNYVYDTSNHKKYLK
jgi:hypothetical protein